MFHVTNHPLTRAIPNESHCLAAVGAVVEGVIPFTRLSGRIVGQLVSSFTLGGRRLVGAAGGSVVKLVI
jgi:hypothetical protein